MNRLNPRFPAICLALAMTVAACAPAVAPAPSAPAAPAAQPPAAPAPTAAPRPAAPAAPAVRPPGPPPGVAQKFKWGAGFALPASLDALSETFDKNHNMVFDRLTWADEKGQVYPSLALSWKVVNSTTWEVQIHQGVKFHNGDQLTAEDVAWSLRRARDEKMPSYTLWYENLADAKATGPYTVQFTTRVPDSFTLSRLSRLFVYPSTYFGKVGKDAFIKDPVGSGPYKWRSFTLGTGFSQERVPGTHPFRKAYLEQIDVDLVLEPATMSAALQTGAIDGAEFTGPPQILEQLKQTNLKIVPALSTISAALWNPQTHCEKNGPLCDPRARRALIISVDRASIAKSIWRGIATPVTQPGIPGAPGYDDKLQLVYDVNEANRLLDEAGLKRGADGMRFSVELAYWRKGPEEASFFAIQDAWKRQIGVDLKLKIMESGAWLQQYRRQSGLDQADMMGILAQDGYANNASYLDRQTVTKVGTNTHYKNEAFYKLRDAAFSEFDPAKRDEAMRKALYEMSEWRDPAMWYLVAVPSTWVLQPYIEGFQPQSGAQFNFDTTYRTR